MKTRKIIIGVMVIGAILVLLGLVFYLYQPKEEVEPYFTPEPETWIESTKKIDKQEVEINIFKATEGESTMIDDQQDYMIGNSMVAFFYHGSYKGDVFTRNYVDKSFYNLSKEDFEGKSDDEIRKIIDSYTRMRITNKMEPNNGIIEGFILAKKENDKFIFYIFVDEDWRKKVEYTNIVWGDDFSDISSLHIKQFDFSNKKEGIYIDNLSGGLDWMKTPISGGLVVGDISIDAFKDLDNITQLGLTFMMVR